MGALLCLKSKYSPGGEFEPDWSVHSEVAGYYPRTDLNTSRVPPGSRGMTAAGGDGGGGPPDTAILVSPEEPRAPAWRNVRERKKSRRTMEREAAAQMAEPAGPPPDAHDSWVSWKRELLSRLA